MLSLSQQIVLPFKDDITAKMNARTQFCTLLGALMIGFQPALSQETDNGATTDPHPDFELVRSKHVAPEYPPRAVQSGREGWVDLAITVNPNGSIANVAVLAAQPKRIFERPAIRAAKKWKFKPPADAGVDVPLTRKYRITFRLE